jgi:hypothetical protein
LEMNLNTSPTISFDPIPFMIKRKCGTHIKSKRHADCNYFMIHSVFIITCIISSTLKTQQVHEAMRNEKRKRFSKGEHNAYLK